MAITQALCTSFKSELLTATHDFTASTGNTFNLALYASTATLDASTTAYTTTGEVSGSGYSAGGQALTNITPTTSGTTAFTDFSDETFSSVTITARGALIYNTDAANAAVLVLDFGSDKTASGGDFVIQFPTADSSNAIIRIA